MLSAASIPRPPAMAPRPLVLVGAGGHAKVLQALIEALGLQIRGVYDPVLAQSGVSSWRGLPVLGNDDALEAEPPNAIHLVNGVGQVVGGRARARLAERLRQRGFLFPALVHPGAWVATSAGLAEGVQVMAGAIVQPDCRIGIDTIVNTRASIDHDCAIGASVHVAPGATLCGGVVVDDEAFIGSGATLLPGLRVGRGCIVGAGVTLTRDLPQGERIVDGATRPMHDGSPREQ